MNRTIEQAWQKRYYFDYISADSESTQYRLYIKGVADTRVTLHHETRQVVYGDGSALLKSELDALNAQLRYEHNLARATYPDLPEYREIV